jgi:hypothetical protein
MVRASADPSAPFYDVLVTPSNGTVVQYRSTQGATALQATTTSGTAPRYVGVGYSGTTFTAYVSSDGGSWTAIPNSSVTINMGTSFLDGVAVTSHTSSALSTVTVSSVLMSGATVPPSRGGSGCPLGWTCTDIGNPQLAGSDSYSGGSWTLKVGGNDIYGTSDTFHLVSRSVTSDGSMSARIVSQQNTEVWAKAGVMFRASTDPAAANYAVFVTPSNGVTVQWRSVAGGSTSNATTSGVVPLFLKITRSGTTFAAYTSANGTTWTLVPNSTQNLPNLAGTVLEGVAATSHNHSVYCTVTVDGLSAA